MKYLQIKDLKDEQFRRLTGVKRTTFERMLGILKEAEKRKKPRVAVTASVALKLNC